MCIMEVRLGCDSVLRSEYRFWSDLRLNILSRVFHFRARGSIKSGCLCANLRSRSCIIIMIVYQIFLFQILCDGASLFCFELNMYDTGILWKASILKLFSLNKPCMVINVIYSLVVFANIDSIRYLLVCIMQNYSKLLKHNLI